MLSPILNRRIRRLVERAIETGATTSTMAVATLVASSTREIHGSGAFPLLPVIHLNLSHSLLTYIRRRSPYGVPLFDRATVHAYALVQLQSRAAARRQRQPEEY
jgi:hypothetical protein